VEEVQPTQGGVQGSLHLARLRLARCTMPYGVHVRREAFHRIAEEDEELRLGRGGGQERWRPRIHHVAGSPFAANLPGAPGEVQLVGAEIRVFDCQEPVEEVDLLAGSRCNGGMTSQEAVPQARAAFLRSDAHEVGRPRSRFWRRRRNGRRIYHLLLPERCTRRG
jgi:hypothetical protein